MRTVSQIPIREYGGKKIAKREREKKRELRKKKKKKIRYDNFLTIKQRAC